MRFAMGLACMVAAGCGRIRFDALSDATSQGGGDAASDALPTGLVVWYPLDEGMADQATDVVSGHGSQCLTACPVTTPAHHGTGFLFNGTTTCLVIPDVGQFGQPQLTIAVWVRHDLSEAASFVAKRVDIGATPLDTWQLETGTPNDLSLTTDHGATNNEQITSPGGLVSIGAFHHLAATFDGTTKREYVDGVEVQNGTSAAPLAYDTNAVSLGCDDNNPFIVLHLTGVLDDFRIYDHPLGAAEIQTLAAM